MLDTKALAQATATIVREQMAICLAPVLERLVALEARADTVAEKGEPGRDGADGKDADVSEIKSFALAAIADAVPAVVEAAIAALPPAERGERGLPGDPGKDGATGGDGLPGKDGIGLADAMIDREGRLVITMTDGRLKNLGPVIGRDGKDGDAGPAGKDGRNGHDVDEISVTQDGAIVEFAFQVDGVRMIFEIELPAGPPGQDGKDAYHGEAKGLFDPEAEYRALDLVSHNGSEWRAKQDNPGELPGAGWMLSACKGKRGDRGERGQAGRDAAFPVAQYLRETELITTLSDGAELIVDLAELRMAGED